MTIKVKESDITKESNGSSVHLSYFGNCMWHYYETDLANQATILTQFVAHLNSIPITDECPKTDINSSCA